MIRLLILSPIQEWGTESEVKSNRNQYVHIQFNRIYFPFERISSTRFALFLCVFFCLVTVAFSYHLAYFRANVTECFKAYANLLSFECEWKCVCPLHINWNKTDLRFYCRFYWVWQGKMYRQKRKYYVYRMRMTRVRENEREWMRERDSKW